MRIWLDNCPFRAPQPPPPRSFLPISTRTVSSSSSPQSPPWPPSSWPPSSPSTNPAAAHLSTKPLPTIHSAKMRRPVGDVEHLLDAICGTRISKILILAFFYCKPVNLKRFTYSKFSTHFERCSNQFPSRYTAPIVRLGLFSYIQSGDERCKKIHDPFDPGDAIGLFRAPLHSL